MSTSVCRLSCVVCRVVSIPPLIPCNGQFCLTTPPTPIVEKNPNKFKIDRAELASRRHFIDATRDEVKSMKEKMSLNRTRDRDITARQPLLDGTSDRTANKQRPFSTVHPLIHVSDPFLLPAAPTAQVISPSQLAAQPNPPVSSNSNSNSNVGGGNGLASSLAGTMAAAAHRHSGTKYSKLENTVDSPGHYALDSPAHRFVGDTVSVQQRMLQGQDEQLDVISDSIGTLKTVSRQIGLELDEQAVYV